MISMRLRRLSYLTALFCCGIFGLDAGCDALLSRAMSALGGEAEGPLLGQDNQKAVLCFQDAWGSSSAQSDPNK